MIPLCLITRQYLWQLVCQKVDGFLSGSDGVEEEPVQAPTSISISRRSSSDSIIVTKASFRSLLNYWSNQYQIVRYYLDFCKRPPKWCNCSPDCKIPYGRCHCGCGEWTKTKGFYNEHGLYVEVGPAKYAPGHNPNLSPSQLRDTLGIKRSKVPQHIIGKERIQDGLYEW